MIPVLQYADENIASLARDFPIEGILQKLSETIWASMEGEPTQEHLGAVQGLLGASERALESILKVDSKCRPTDEWMRAVEIAEGIRDECLETIAMLEMM